MVIKYLRTARTKHTLSFYTQRLAVPKFLRPWPLKLIQFGVFRALFHVVEPTKLVGLKLSSSFSCTWTHQFEALRVIFCTYTYQTAQFWRILNNFQVLRPTKQLNFEVFWTICMYLDPLNSSILKHFELFSWLGHQIVFTAESWRI